MEPSVALPREHQAIAIGPEDLCLRLNSVKRAAGTFFGVPHRAAYAAGRVRYSNRPRSRRIPHRTDRNRGGIRSPHECNPAAVGTPDGRSILVDARVQVDESFGRDAVHADEAVIATIASEGQRRAVRRPCEFIRGCFGVNGFERLRTVERGHPELPVFYKCDMAVPRHCGSAAVAQFLRRTTIEGNRIDRLLGRLGKIPGIGDVAVGLEIAAAGIRQETPVDAPRDVTQVLAVVILIRGEPTALVIRRGGYPNIARTTFVEDPGDFPPPGATMNSEAKGAFR